MNRLAISKSKPRVVVGLDFGTTFSGFAFALVSKPKKVHLFYKWPASEAAGADNYCKTQTSLLYLKGESPTGSYALEDWGYEALVKYAKSLQLEELQHHVKDMNVRESSARRKHKSRSQLIAGNNDGDDSPSVTAGSHAFITRFKLLLAEQGGETSEDDAHFKLPTGLTARRTISDYLRKLSEQVLIVLREKLGKYISREDIQWCLTVPAIYDEPAKQEMKVCAEIAGLVQGQYCSDKESSPHPIIIVLEPEAASVYCQLKSGLFLCNGDRFMVVDVGGGTVDLVLHERVDYLKVREISPSSGGLCGGTYVDHGFFNFLCGKMKCFRKFSEEHPESMLKIRGWWEKHKCVFDGTMHFPHELELPKELTRAWVADEQSKHSPINSNSSFDSIDISLEDMLSIFDPAVEKILMLIEAKMIDGLKAIMFVGGFSGSPYLKKRIKQKFSGRVEAIVMPTEPGSAICWGAVKYALDGADLITSRISKNTYGLSSSRPFVRGDPRHLITLGPGGLPYCHGVFEAYVRKGDEVAIDKCVSHVVSPVFSFQTSCEFILYSTRALHPTYVDETGVAELGRFEVNFPSEGELGKTPEIIVSLYFGRTTIEVKAVGLNFHGESFSMPPVTFQKSSQI